MLNTNERRTFPRYRLERPAKLHVLATGKYLAGSTVDVSPGGVLVRVELGTNCPIGADVEVGVAEHASQPVIRQADMMRGTVIRSVGHDGAGYLAVRFTEVQCLAASA